MSTTRHYIVKAEGLFLETVQREPVDAVEVFGGIPQPTRIYPCLGEDWYLWTNDEDWGLLKLLTGIPMRADAQLDVADGAAVFRPRWASTSGAAIGCEFTLAPEPGQWGWALWFGSIPQGGASFLYGIDFGADGQSLQLRFPGVPNVYDNCAICSGEAATPQVAALGSRGIQVWADLWLTAWNEAKWNADLACAFSRRIRFDPETKTSIARCATPEEYRDSAARAVGADSPTAIVRQVFTMKGILHEPAQI